MPPSPLQCPQCGQLDAVRKITAVLSQETRSGTTKTVAGGMIGGHWAGGLAHSQNRDQSHLCQRLTCPKKPTPTPMAALLGCFAFFAVASIIGSLGMLIKGEDQKKALLTLFVGAPVFALLAYGAHTARPAAEAMDAEKLARWQEVENVCSQGYYCGRCDGVFEAGDKAISSPEDALSLKG